MGYYTTHELNVYEADSFPAVKVEIDDEQIDAMFTSSLKDFSYYNLEESLKWYDCDKDMAKMSAEHPDYVFEMYGDGEEGDDFWKEIWYRGKSKSVSGFIAYPAIDLSALGMKDPTDPTPPREEPENSFFFAKESNDVTNIG